MTQKEQNMMKLVSYYFFYIEAGRVSKEKKEKLFVEVYNHFNRKNKKRLTKKSDIVVYMSELRKQRQRAAISKLIKRDRGKLFATALVAGITCLALGNRIERRTED